MQGTHLKHDAPVLRQLRHYGLGMSRSGTSMPQHQGSLWTLYALDEQIRGLDDGMRHGDVHIM